MIEGKPIEKAWGYYDIDFDIAGRAWCISDRTDSFRPYFLKSFKGNWVGMSRPDGKKIYRIAIAENGDAWAIAEADTLYHFDLERELWTRIRDEIVPEGVTPQALMLKADVATGDRGRGEVITTGGSQLQAEGQGWRTWILRQSIWSKNTERWFLQAEFHPTIQGEMIGMSQGNYIYLKGRFGKWGRYVMRGKDGKNRLTGRQMVSSNSAFCVLLKNGKQVHFGMVGDKTDFYDCPRVDNKLPNRISRAPNNLGIALLYSNSAVRFWNPIA